MRRPCPPLLEIRVPVLEKRRHDHSAVLDMISRLSDALCVADPDDAERIRGLASMEGVDLDEEDGVPGLVLSMLLDESWFSAADRSLVFEAADTLEADRAAWCVEQSAPRHQFPIEDALHDIVVTVSKPFVDAIGPGRLFGYGGDDAETDAEDLLDDKPLVSALRMMNAYGNSMIERGAYPDGDDRALPHAQEEALVTAIRLLIDRLGRYFEDNHLAAWAARQMDRVRGRT